MRMNRRELVLKAGATLMVSGAAGCENITLVDEREGETIDPVTSNELFYTYACCGPPADLTNDNWVCSIQAGTTELAQLDTARLETFEVQEREHTLQCIGGNPSAQLISNAIWGGLPLRDVLDELGVEVPASAVGMRLVGHDDYHAGLPIEVLDAGPIWLVWEMNGEPMPFMHGAPARLLVPGHYGVKNLKWLKEIAFVNVPHVSYWTEFSWDEEAKYNANGFIATPADGITLRPEGSIRFIGTAHAGSDPVELVEIRLDDGPWEPATLDYNPGADRWTLWSWEWSPDNGDHTIKVRVTTASGAMSSDDPAGTDQFMGYDGSMEIGITVRT